MNAQNSNPLQKPTMVAMDWEETMGKLETTLQEIQQETNRIGRAIDKLVKENNEIDQEIEEIFGSNK